MPEAVPLPGSFRDPSGFLFTRDGVLYRQINSSFADDYELLVSSGLYEELTRDGSLISHREVSDGLSPDGSAFKVIQPELVPFISYPSEWSFSQLKDAALLTLSLAERALKKGMILKDATAYNVQFVKGRPVFIDTLSFEKYEEGIPWVAYRQFCQHFLAPLALMALTDVSLGKLFQIYVDGVPLELASRLLPFRTRFNIQLFLHIHLHARSQKKYSAKTLEKGTGRKLPRSSLLGIFDGLRSAISSLEWKPEGTEWGDYYEATNYSPTAMDAKQTLVRDFVLRKKPKMVWDLGANTGVFSAIAADTGATVVSFDIDPAAVEKNYRSVKQKKADRILPLVLDLTNPTPAMGWAGEERESLRERGPVDVALALALIHHLAISNNVPLERLARFFAGICTNLVIEFVPKSDSQVQRLLSSRKDIFPEYTKEGFERAFKRYFSIEDARGVEGSERTLYLLTRLAGGTFS